MTRSSALSARPSHSRSSPAGYLFPIDPIDHRHAHEPWNRRALKRSERIVKCFDPEPQGGKWRTIRRGAMGLALFGIAGWIWRQNNRSSAGDAQTTDDETTNQRRP